MELLDLMHVTRTNKWLTFSLPDHIVNGFFDQCDKSVDKITWCYHSNDTYFEQLLRTGSAIYFLEFYEKKLNFGWNVLSHLKVPW